MAEINTEPVSIVPVADPFSSDAPIEQLLSVRDNPDILNATPEQLQALIQKFRTYASSAPTLSSKLQSDSDRVNPAKRNTNAAKRKAIMDEL